ncbi:MAG: hypothetical protein AB1696_07780 [Planctomycetota bacterium]
MAKAVTFRMALGYMALVFSCSLAQECIAQQPWDWHHNPNNPDNVKYRCKKCQMTFTRRELDAIRQNRLPFEPEIPEMVCPYCYKKAYYKKDAAADTAKDAANRQTKKVPDPNEITIVLKNDNRFAGVLIREDDKTIKIKSTVDGASMEMEWNKNQIKEIIRPEKPAPQTQASNPLPEIILPCQVQFGGIAIKGGDAVAELHLDWSGTTETVKPDKVTVVFLFLPAADKACLGPEILAEERPYSSEPASDKLWRMTAEIAPRKPDGAVGDGGILLFLTKAGAALDLSQSGQYSFPIPIQEGGKWEGNPRLMGKGELAAAVFVENDPKNQNQPQAQLRGSRMYRLVSNVVSQAVTLQR